MIRIDQTTFGASNGNCFSACVASILEMPLEGLPVYLSHDWILDWKQWLRGRGYGIISCDAPPEEDTVERRYDRAHEGYWIVGGPNEKGVGHAVLYLDGEMVHDPNPSRKGLAEIEDWTLIFPLDPLKAGAFREEE